MSNRFKKMQMWYVFVGVVIVFVIGVSVALADFQGPPASPPTGDALLNVNASGQLEVATTTIFSSQICFGADCRSSWPSGGSGYWALGSNSSIYYASSTRPRVAIGTSNPIWYFEINRTATETVPGDNILSGSNYWVDSSLSSNTNAHFKGLYGFVGGNTNDSFGSFIGSHGFANMSGVGTIDNLIGAMGTAGLSNGQSSRLSGLVAQVLLNNASATASSASGLYIESPVVNGTLTNLRGIYIADQNIGAATNKYAIHYNGATPFVVRADGRVGIGTSTPEAALNIVGVTPDILVNGATAGDYAATLRLAGGVDNWRGGYIAYDDTDIGASYGRLSIGIHDADDKQSASDIDVVHITRPVGNVGIGTSTPAHKLDVVGSIRGTQLCIGSDCRSSWPVGGGSGSSYWTLGSGGIYYASSTNPNVGIGTSAPQFPVHVSDGNAISSALTTSDKIVASYNNTAPGFSFVVGSNTPTHRGVFKGARARGSVTSPTVPQMNDDVVSFLGAIYDGSTTWGTAMVGFVVDGAVSAGVAPQRIGFFTGETNSRTERLTVKSNGFIGIATTTPQATLDVAGNARISGALTLASSTGSIFVANDPGVQTILLSNDNITNVNNISINDDGVGEGITWGNGRQISMYTVSQGGYNAFVFDTAPTSPFVFNTGNVGIGTTNPSYLLQVNGDIRALNNIYYSNNFQLVDGPTGTYGIKTDTTNGLSLLSNSTTPRLTIDTGGEVGIGTTVPNAALEVVGGIRLNATAAKPSCSATTRGTAWFTQGVSGVKDAFEVCAKDAANVYAWRLLY